MASTPLRPIVKHFLMNVDHIIEQCPKKGYTFFGFKLHIVKPSSLMRDFGGIKQIPMKDVKQAGAELCQAPAKLGLPDWVSPMRKTFKFCYTLIQMCLEINYSEWVGGWWW